VWEGNWGNGIVFCRELGRDLSEGMAACRWVQNCVCVLLVTGNTNSKIWSIRILFVACETGCVMLTRGQSVTVFGSRVLERAVRDKNDVATGELRELHDEELRKC